MSGRDDEEDARGWSAVFKVDDKSAPRKKSKRANPEQERTIIDREISGVLAKEIEKEIEKSQKRKLPKVIVPVVDETVLDHGQDDLNFNESTAPHRVPPRPPARSAVSVNLEATMVDAPALPPEAFVDEDTADQGVGSIDPEDEEELLHTPAIPAHMLKELGSPNEKPRLEEMTVLDVAAQLGLAPEKLREAGLSAQRPVPRIIEVPHAPQSPHGGQAAHAPHGAHAAHGPHAPHSPHSPHAQLMQPTPLAEQGAKVGEMLADEAEALAGHPVFKNPAALKRLHRGETMLQHLPRWLFITEGAAKIIPVLLATFVIFATVGALVMVFSGLKGHDQEHVTLKFLASRPAAAAPGSPDPTAIHDASAPTPMITIDTEPPGILVVLDRKILGATPLTFELPVRAPRIGVELTSPYFETFVTEAVKNEAGEMRVKAKLIRKR